MKLWDVHETEYCRYVHVWIQVSLNRTCGTLLRNAHGKSLDQIQVMQDFCTRKYTDWIPHLIIPQRQTREYEIRR
jgi:hypothetical protein